MKEFTKYKLRNAAAWLGALSLLAVVSYLVSLL